MYLESFEVVSFEPASCFELVEVVERFVTAAAGAVDLLQLPFDFVIMRLICQPELLGPRLVDLILYSLELANHLKVEHIEHFHSIVVAFEAAAFDASVASKASVAAEELVRRYSFSLLVVVVEDL